MDQNELLMQLMGGAHEGVHAGRSATLQLEDPQAVDWGSLAQRFQLTPGEIQELQIPQPEGGPTLAERLARLKPQLRLGDINMELSGRGVRGRMEF